MLSELADLVESSEDDSLDDVAMRLRLLSADPALRTTERDFDEVLLNCDEAQLRLIKRTRVSGPLQLTPAFRLECEDNCPDQLCCGELLDERSAVAAFVAAQAKLRSRQ